MWPTRSAQSIPQRPRFPESIQLFNFSGTDGPRSKSWPAAFFSFFLRSRLPRNLVVASRTLAAMSQSQLQTYADELRLQALQLGTLGQELGLDHMRRELEALEAAEGDTGDDWMDSEEGQDEGAELQALGVLLLGMAAEAEADLEAGAGARGPRGPYYVVKSSVLCHVSWHTRTSTSARTSVGGKA